MLFLHSAYHDGHFRSQNNSASLCNNKSEFFTKAQQDKNCLSKRLTGDFNQKTSNLKSQWLPLGGSNGLLAKVSASVVGAADTRSFEHRPGHRTPKYPLGNGSVTVRDRLLLFKAPLKFSFAFALVTW